MCCFSRSVIHVSGTRIFARPIAKGRQALVYSMSLEADEGLAMILPLPVPAGVADDAVRFVDLSAYPTFFTDLDRAFPALAVEGAFQGIQQDVSRGGPRLVVHEVGDFEASFVPRSADFSRLDPRFRMPSGVFDRLPAYADWGFAVFQLKLGAVGGFFARLFGRRKSTQKTIHPMAFEFPTRTPDAIFFPTMHVHDGAVHPKADFDHTLVFQTGPLQVSTGSAQPSSDALGRFVDARAGSLVDRDAPGYKLALRGSRANEDTWIRPSSAPADAAA